MAATLGETLMKRSVAISLIFLIFGSVVAAQERRLSSAPKSFQTFFAKFKSVVRKGDRNGVAAMTSFPFKYAYDAGDEGQYNRTRFLQNFRIIFGPSTSRFMPQRNPMFSRGDGDTFNIDTEDASHYVFIKSGKTYKFSGYFVEP